MFVSCCSRGLMGRYSLEVRHFIKLIETETGLVVTRGWGSRGKGEILVRVQMSSYKINKFWGSNVQHSDYSY